MIIKTAFHVFARTDEWTEWMSICTCIWEDRLTVSFITSHPAAPLAVKYYTCSWHIPNSSCKITSLCEIADDQNLFSPVYLQKEWAVASRKARTALSHELTSKCWSVHGYRGSQLLLRWPFNLLIIWDTVLKLGDCQDGILYWCSPRCAFLWYSVKWFDVLNHRSQTAGHR